MLQIEPIENLAGFGDSNSQGEYYHSENMTPGQFGLEANLSIIQESTSDSPDRFNWFTEYDSIPHAIDITGKIFNRISGDWNIARTPSNAGTGNGLITDQTGRLLYAQNQYLGMYDGSWHDSWKDFVTLTAEFRPMDLYEDWVVIGNGNAVAVLNVTDESFSEDALTLPSGFVVRAIISNKSGILIGANVGGRSVIFLWDAQAPRSISEWIWSDHKIQSICKYGSRWVVTTSKEQFITDGYSTTPLPTFPDTLEQTDIYRCIPAGTLAIGNKLFTANTDVNLSLNRLKNGLWTQDLTTGMFSFAPVANGCTADMVMGALFNDSSFHTYISYSTNKPDGNFVGRVEKSSPSQATFISPRLGQGTNPKVAEGLKVDVTNVPTTKTILSSRSFKIAVKIYNFKRPLWGFGSTNNASTDENKLKVAGNSAGFNNAKIGDEVTILSGVNAGQIRHITAITGQNSANEVWTLDSDLPELTESDVLLNVQPFQLVSSKTITLNDYAELTDLYFDIKNKIKGKKFLAKVVLTDITNLSLAIPSLTFIYDDKGVI